MDEAFELSVNVVFEPTEAFELEASVPASDLTFRLYLSVPKPETIGGFLLDVPYV
jgi:hypothetical protein